MSDPSSLISNPFTALGAIAGPAIHMVHETRLAVRSLQEEAGARPHADRAGRSTF